MKKINLVLDFDDLSPSKKYGIEKDKGTYNYINRLQDEFVGLKVTLFVPANFENSANLKFNLDWVNWLKNKPNIEIACHGCTHYSQQNKTDVREFFNIGPEETEFKIKEALKIFEEVGIKVKGIKAPGWDINPYFLQIASEFFDYCAEHRIGTDVEFTKENFALVPYTYSVDDIGPKFFDTIILHGHISQEKGNKNGLNDLVYSNIRNYLSELNSKFEINYMTMSELVELKRNKN